MKNIILVALAVGLLMANAVTAEAKRGGKGHCGHGGGHYGGGHHSSGKHGKWKNSSCTPNAQGFCTQPHI